MNTSSVHWTVITGSTGGIGCQIAKILAERGDSMILVNRSKEKANIQCSELLATHPDLKIELVTADFMDTHAILSAIEKINALPGQIDALYNNSGVLTGEKIMSSQGFESHFAVNTLAPYQLIQGLCAKMARPTSVTPAMIVNFSSSAISPLKSLELKSLTNPEEVGGLMSTYAQTKLAVTAMTAALADSLQARNILIRAIDPGATKSAMTTGGNSGMPWFLRYLAPLLFSSADKQAVKIVESADPLAFSGRTGLYIANKKEKKMPVPALDPKSQKDLLSLLEDCLVNDPNHS